jgi:hypothetical protein
MPDHICNREGDLSVLLDFKERSEPIMNEVSNLVTFKKNHDIQDSRSYNLQITLIVLVISSIIMPVILKFIK